MQKYISLIFLGITVHFTFASVEQNLNNLNLTGLPELPSNISSKIPSTEDVEKALAKKCKKLGGQDAYDKAVAAKERAKDCIKDLVNFDQLQQEMEEAKPTGDLDSVFKKYCKKSPEFKGCIANFTKDFEPCLEENEKKSVTTVLNVTEQLAEFICYKEGDRIALFIAEGGPECLNASKDGIKACAESVFKNVPNPEDDTISDIPLLLFKAEQCEDFFKLQTCVVQELEKCKEPTPANIVGSLFNFIKKVTPCSSHKTVEPKSEVKFNSGAALAYNSVSTFITVFFGISVLSLISSH